MNTPVVGLRIAMATVLVVSLASFASSLGAAPPPETATAPSTNADSTPGRDRPGCPAMPGMNAHEGQAMAGSEGCPMGRDGQATMGGDGHGMMRGDGGGMGDGHAMGSDGRAMGGDCHAMMGMHKSSQRGAMPVQPGQDAFGAIQEIVAKLDADPKTDWSKVDLEALRQHLIDMNEVTLQADAKARPIDGGIEIAVTGSGRTLAAIERMIPTHAQAIDGSNGWSARTESLPNGVLLTVTAKDPKEVQHIRGLGFIGILVSGFHHQAHHLAMAQGALPGAHGHGAPGVPASKP